MVTGLVTVGDSAYFTNPSLGRGMSMGLLHAVGTLEVIGKHLGAPLTLAAEHDQMTQARVIPWYQATVEFDRARKEQMDAAIEGRPAPQPTDTVVERGAVDELPVSELHDPGEAVHASPARVVRDDDSLRACPETGPVADDRI